MTGEYEFRIRGRLGAVMRSALSDLVVTGDPPHSVLVGSAGDLDAIGEMLAVLGRNHVTITEIRLRRHGQQVALPDSAELGHRWEDRVRLADRAGRSPDDHAGLVSGAGHDALQREPLDLEGHAVR
jgi:hypothetical protein